MKTSMAKTNECDLTIFVFKLLKAWTVNATKNYIQLHLLQYTLKMPFGIKFDINENFGSTGIENNEIFALIICKIDYVSCFTHKCQKHY